MAAEGLLHIRINRPALEPLPEGPGLAQKRTDNQAVDIAAAIAANVDDQAVLVEMLVIVACKTGDIACPHRPQMQIADLSIGRLGDGFAVMLDPVEIAQVSRIAQTDRNDDLAMAFSSPRNLEQNLLTGAIVQRVRQVRQGVYPPSVNRLYDVAFPNIDTRPKEGAKRVGAVALTVPDRGDFQTTGNRCHIRAKRGRGAAFSIRKLIARPDLAVQDAKFRRHLCQQVIEFGAMTEAAGKWQVVITNLCPVDRPQARVKGKVAVKPPGVLRHLLPLRLRIEPQRPVSQTHGAGPGILGHVLTRIDDQEARG